MRILLLPLLLLLLPPPLLAQTVAPAPRNWSLGFRGGLGLSAYPDFSNYTLWSGGGLAGYYLPRARLSLYAEALFDGRQALRQPTRASNIVVETDPCLFLPVGIRTGRPNSRAHLLLQAGPVLALSTPQPTADGYRAWPVAAAAVVGVEMRLNSRAQPHEVLLGLHLREGLTPAADRIDPAAGYSQPAHSYFWWTGATLSWVWHHDGHPLQ